VATRRRTKRAMDFIFLGFQELRKNTKVRRWYNTATNASSKDRKESSCGVERLK
jgi:hypothetical protein